MVQMRASTFVPNNLFDSSIYLVVLIPVPRFHQCVRRIRDGLRIVDSAFGYLVLGGKLSSFNGAGPFYDDLESQGRIDACDFFIK